MPRQLPDARHEGHRQQSGTLFSSTRLSSSSSWSQQTVFRLPSRRSSMPALHSKVRVHTIEEARMKANLILRSEVLHLCVTKPAAPPSNVSVPSVLPRTARGAAVNRG